MAGAGPDSLDRSVEAALRLRWSMLSPLATPGARALRAGALASGIGEAFAAGYQEALDAALGPAAAGAAWRPLRALCVTEAAGNDPRSLRATVTVGAAGLRLQARKRYATLGTSADELWVAARLHPDLGAVRPTIALVCVAPTAPGVVIAEMPGLGFAPEVAHAELAIDVELPLSALRPGDGWEEVVKPFGALEDALVRAAIAAHLASCGGAARWPAPLVAALTRAAANLAAFDRRAAVGRAAWGALEAALQTLDAALPAVDAAFAAATDAAVEGSAAARWRRDRPLLAVAGRRRAARLAASRSTEIIG